MRAMLNIVFAPALLVASLGNAAGQSLATIGGGVTTNINFRITLPDCNGSGPLVTQGGNQANNPLFLQETLQGSVTNDCQDIGGVNHAAAAQNNLPGQVTSSAFFQAQLVGTGTILDGQDDMIGGVGSISNQQYQPSGVLSEDEVLVFHGTLSVNANITNGLDYVAWVGGPAGVDVTSNNFTGTPELTGTVVDVLSGETRVYQLFESVGLTTDFSIIVPNNGNFFLRTNTNVTTPLPVDGPVALGGTSTAVIGGQLSIVKMSELPAMTTFFVFD